MVLSVGTKKVSTLFLLTNMGYNTYNNKENKR